jgi:hypothetical protein
MINKICSVFKNYGECKIPNCMFKHELEQKKHRKNTETFKPSHKPVDVKLLFESAKDKTKTTLNFSDNDIFVVKDLFTDLDYKEIVDEVENSREKIWKLWHGDTHLIADDHTKYKELCPKFCEIVEKMANYFNIKVEATRFNLYRDGSDWKPFHHDAAAIDPKKANKQNITIGLSLGATREAAFECAKAEQGNRRVLSIPLENGSIYGFTKNINIEWRHGILQLPIEQQRSIGNRVSIILWGSKI